MKRLSKIIIIVVIIVIFVLYFLYFKKPVLDKSCNVDSDCLIESAQVCGYGCKPSDEDVYNKNTINAVRRWKSNPFISYRCVNLAYDCMFSDESPINYVPKCINRQCIIEKSINCNSKVLICKINESVKIGQFFEKELAMSIENIKKTCNCI